MKRRYVSIMGDSISTYAGYNPQGYSVFYDENNQKRNGLRSVYDTWWAKVNQYLSAYICMNNSFSGSMVTGLKFPSASSTDRIKTLHNQMTSPDIILIYIGCNDFGRGVKVRNSLRGVHTSDNFFDCYTYMLKGIKAFYPSAHIVCGTLMRSYIKDKINWVFPENFAGEKFSDFNVAIREATHVEKCSLADLESLNYRYETLDGIHPTVQGHAMLAQAWVECLRKERIV